MITRYHKLALTAAFALAMAFTFSCSDDDNQGGQTSLCGGIGYDPSIYRCELGELIGKCRGEDYYVTYERCVDGVVVDNNNSSSSVNSCASFVNGTKREHYGKEKEQFCDSRDGKKYVYVEIGGQTWMAENLNYDVENSTCLDDDPANCEKYGRLYTWATAMALPISCNTNSCSSYILAKHKGICPYGWHIPTNAESDNLMLYVVGGSISVYGTTAGKYLKTTSGWNKSGNGTDDYGFSLLPINDGEGGPNGNDSWWRSSELGSSLTYYRLMYYGSEPAVLYYDYKRYLINVRCLKDD